VPYRLPCIAGPGLLAFCLPSVASPIATVPLLPAPSHPVDPGIADSISLPPCRLRSSRDTLRRAGTCPGQSVNRSVDRPHRRCVDCSAPLTPAESGPATARATFPLEGPSMVPCLHTGPPRLASQTRGPEKLALTFKAPTNGLLVARHGPRDRDSRQGASSKAKSIQGKTLHQVPFISSSSTRLDPRSRVGLDMLLRLPIQKPQFTNTRTAHKPETRPLPLNG
jgi:hypothetical protein